MKALTPRFHPCLPPPQEQPCEERVWVESQTYSVTLDKFLDLSVPCLLICQAGTTTVPLS